MSFRSLTLVACAAGLVLTSHASAQGFRGVFARDAVDAIAVGDDGEVYRTLDGGNTWTERVLGPPVVRLRHVAARGFTFVVVGEGGAIWKSTDSGGTWAVTTASGTPSLRALAMPADSVWYAAGSGGTLLKTTNAGGTWTLLTSGTGVTLNALCFTDALNGWVAGDAGTLLVTHNGGAWWSPVPLGTPNHLLGVDQRGATVWVVGAEGTAFRSVNGGSSFTPVQLKLDARADVRAVAMRSPDTLWIAGGGGFLRATTDGGATWTFPQHSMHGPIVDMSAAGAAVFACNSANRVVLASTDLGASWHFPTGATLARTWGASPRYDSLSGPVRGSTFALNPVFKSTIYCAIGNDVLRSRDDGETWSVAASFPFGYAKCNAFVVSPRDSNLWLAAVGGSTVADRVMRSTNGGATWDTTLTHDFGEYGQPLEMDPDHPDTVWFGGELALDGSPLNPLIRSTNFGLTWSSYSNAMFRSPCDIVVVPDSTALVLVSDGVTGSGRGRHLRSTDGGATFVVTDSISASEIPGLACSRLAPSSVVGTCWSSGGVQRSANFGAAWAIADNIKQAWGIDISRDDPNVVVFGQYTDNPPFAYISLDGGASYTAIPQPTSGFNNNYGFYVRDRATILALQINGIWKLENDYSYTPSAGAQAVTVVAPNGGETWTPGSRHSIQWTAANVALARLEYRRAPGEPWQHIADAAGYQGSYAWIVPGDATTEAKVRVYDAWDGSPVDSSNAVFTIAPSLAVGPEEGPAFSLRQNRPNPFTRATVIEYTMAREAEVALEVFDLRGQRVARLASGHQAAGAHRVEFGGMRGGSGGARPAAGVYFYRLRAGGYESTRRMLFVP